jgi:hypothetical protein
MKIEEREFDWSEGGGIALENPVSVKSRHPGPHVSDIIRDMANIALYPGERKPFEELTDGERKRMGNYVNMGFIWERIIEKVLAQQFFGEGNTFRPGEIVLDGIAGNPDGVSSDWAVEEFKATWRSSGRGIGDPSFWTWFVQIKAYCQMLAATRANLRVFWVNGNYRESGPQTSFYAVEFTERELQENWNMLLNHARQRGML